MRKRYVFFSTFMCATMLIVGMCYGSYRYSQREAKIKEERIQAAKEAAQVSTADEIKIGSETKYIVEIYNEDTEDIVREESTMPSEYAGMNREELETYLSQSVDATRKMTLETGLKDIKLISFSKSEVVIRKVYQSDGEQRQFLLKLEDGEVVVYDPTGEIFYENTGIQRDSLPDEEIEKLEQGYRVDSEKDLYSILENYSS